jgi:S1-C subfamily serine protease
LIGLNVAVYSEGQGIGFAIPAREVAEALSATFTPEVQTSQWFGLEIHSGKGPLRLKKVDRDSPAEKAGLRVGDVLLRVNQEAPRSFVHCMVLLATGDSKVEVEVQRGSEPRTFTVQPVPLQRLVQQRLGLTLQEMDAALAQQFGLRAGQGLVVTHVEPGSPAAEANLEAGHVVTAIDEILTPDLIGAFAALADKPAQAKTILTVLVEQRRGMFARLRQARVQVEAR